MMPSSLPRALILIGAFMLFAACESPEDGVSPIDPDAVEPDTVETPLGLADPLGEVGLEATAMLEPIEGDVRGIVLFRQADDALQVNAEIGGLGEGMHRLLIFDVHSCANLDASRSPRGNVGEIDVADDGTGRVEELVHNLRIEGSESITGNVIAVSSGDGRALACGEIGPAVH